MIYAGLVLRLGLTTEEEMSQFTRSAESKDDSFIDIVLKRGIINQDQYRAIQEMLAGAERSPAFRKKALSGQAAQPVVDQMALPTMVMKPGDADDESGETLTAPMSTPAPIGYADPSESPTVRTPIPSAPGTRPSSLFPRPTTTRTGAGSSAIDWSTLTGTLTRDEIQNAERSRETHGDSLIGTQLGGYVILDKLGKGGMGEVYLAKQLALNRYVALKVLPELLARNKDFVSRFISEAQTLARINYPGIIQVYDVGTEGDMVYFTMELVRGKTIQDHIKANKTIPVPMAVNIIKQSCRALARVGREGIIHRDIKPSNIMLTDEGEVKVCDFGIATARLDKKAIKEIIGTPYYIAPEYLSGEECTALSDQYSLGVTFYHMLDGLPAAGGRGFMIETDTGRLSDKNSAIPQEISEVVARMTQPSPGQRYDNFEEIFHKLETYEMKVGIIDAPSEFLADRLVAMREMGWENLKKWVGAFSLAAVGFTALALIVNKILLRAGMARAIGLTGGWGTIMIFVAYFMILYVGLARRRILPAFGNLKTWVETHYTIALIGYFLVMVHSGNFLAWGLIKKSLSPIPGLGAANWGDVPTVAFLCSVALFLVIISGLVGRFIFRELHKQLALERFGERTDISADEKQSLTRLVIGTKIMAYWRILHYPMTVFMILLVLLHVASILYYGGSFFGN